MLNSKTFFRRIKIFQVMVKSFILRIILLAFKIVSLNTAFEFTMHIF